jgi:hypothetical protein
VAQALALAALLMGNSGQHFEPPLATDNGI